MSAANATIATPKKRKAKTKFVLGRPKKFTTPEALWKAAGLYFRYCVDNPIPVTVCRYGKIMTIPRVQAMSFKGLSMHLGISNLKYYKSLPEYERIMDRISNTIYVHNFTHAAAGLLNGKVIGNTIREH